MDVVNVEIVVTFGVLISVFLTLTLSRVTPSLVAMTGMAVLIAAGVLDTGDALSVFSSSAPVTIACMFVIAAALSEAGFIDWLGDLVKSAAHKHQVMALVALLGFVFVISAFMNNTPTVIILAPVMLKLAESMNSTPHRFLIPLSYVAIMGGMTTLIGTSTNIIIDSVATENGLDSFYIFEITLPAMIMAAGGIAFLAVVGPWLLPRTGQTMTSGRFARMFRSEKPQRKQLDLAKLGIALPVLVTVVVCASFDLLPIAGLAFIGAVTVILTGCITTERAYASMDWSVLMLIFGMLGIGKAMETSGAAGLLVESIVRQMADLGPLYVLAAVYLMTSILTETVTNNAIAVIMTPLVIGMTESLGFDPRPFVVAVMLAASASFATPIGYQTNTFVYMKGGYTFADFLRIGLPMNLLMWGLAMVVIPFFYPLDG